MSQREPHIGQSGREHVVVCQYDGIVTMRTLPLAAGLVVASARRDPRVSRRFTFRIRTARERPSDAAASFGNATIIGFSCYVWNLNYSLEVARIAKASSKKRLVVMGGPSIPRHPESVSRFMRKFPWIDVLVHGEGERTFTEVLAALAGPPQPLTMVPGVTFRTGTGAWSTTARRARATAFDAAASPYLDGTFDGLIEASDGLPDAALVETNRGCPFSCTFCDWGQATGTPVQEIPIARVEGELEWIAKRGIGYLYIVDANFGIRPRDERIAGTIGHLRQTTGFPESCFFHLTKNATERNILTVEALNRASVSCQVTLSQQDFDSEVLAAVRRSNISIDRWRSLADRCRERHIPTLNELLLGLPEQTYDSFASGIIQALSPHAGDTFHLYLCRLLENAELSETDSRRRFGIETRMVPLRDAAGQRQWVDEMEEVVVATRSLAEEDWKRAFRFGFFASAIYNFGLLRTVILFFSRTSGSDLREWIESLLECGKPEGVLSRMRLRLDREADAILDGIRPNTATNDVELPGVDARVAALALRHHTEFLDEVHDVTRKAVRRWRLPAEREIDEAFGVERLRTPGPGRSLSEEQDFAFDWISYIELSGNGPLRRGTTTIRYRAPAWAERARSTEEFVHSWVAAAYAKTSEPSLVRSASALSESRQ